MRPCRTWTTGSLRRASLRAPCTSSRGPGALRSSSGWALVRSRPQRGAGGCPRNPRVRCHDGGRFRGRRPGRGGNPEDTLRRRRGIAPLLRFLDLHLTRAALEFLAYRSVPRSMPTSTARRIGRAIRLQDRSHRAQGPSERSSPGWATVTTGSTANTCGAGWQVAHFESVG